jgi:hypothetical protein
LHFAGGGAGKFVDHDESLGKLLFGKTGDRQPLDDIDQPDNLADFWHHDGANSFAKNGIGGGYDSSFGDLRVFE